MGGEGRRWRCRERREREREREREHERKREGREGQTAVMRLFLSAFAFACVSPPPLCEQDRERERRRNRGTQGRGVERESLFEEAAVARETREGDRERGGRRTLFVGGGLGAWATENSLFFFLFFVLFCDTLLPGRDMRVTKGEGEESRKKKKSQKRGEKIQTPFGLFPRSLSLFRPY